MGFRGHRGERSLFGSNLSFSRGWVVRERDHLRSEFWVKDLGDCGRIQGMLMLFR